MAECPIWVDKGKARLADVLKCHGLPLAESNKVLGVSQAVVPVAEWAAECPVAE